MSLHSSSVDANYSLLAAVVSDLTAGGRLASAAAVKTLMLRESPNFDERALGHRKFVEYLEAAAHAGAVRLARDDRNHPCVFPAETSDAVIDAAVLRSSTTVAETRRLKRELWRAVVDWEPSDYWRGWDRKHGRVFMTPQTSTNGEPWADDAERYVALPIVSRELQAEWMDEFAAAQMPAVKDELLFALQPGAVLGAFRTTLAAHGLLDDWAKALQLHVNVHVQQWATASKVPLQRLFDSPARRADLGPVGAPSGGSVEPATIEGAVAAPERSFDDALRRRLHNVIEQMNGAELSVITVPARFLVGS